MFYSVETFDVFKYFKGDQVGLYCLTIYITMVSMIKILPTTLTLVGVCLLNTNINININIGTITIELVAYSIHLSSVFMSDDEVLIESRAFGYGTTGICVVCGVISDASIF